MNTDSSVNKGIYLKVEQFDVRHHDTQLPSLSLYIFPYHG